MSTLTDYRGLQVVDPEPTGAGGLAIQDDLKQLVDWHPRSEWAQTADPGVDDDITEDFFAGSLWLRTNTSPVRLFVCKDNTSGAAVWEQVAMEENVALLSGRSGGQSLNGGTGSGESLVLTGNSVDGRMVHLSSSNYDGERHFH